MKCSINDIANVISESIPNPAESGYGIFVGLEHYDSGEVKITRYGSTENLVTAVKVFQKGDILLARRNVYLKRAGLVDFDGVTSGDSIVLRVKTDLSSLGLSSVSVQKYLPFVLNTEEFWNYAEKYSDGTMSKRLSPKTLLQYEFDIPENIDEKNDLLWAAFEAKESYRAMIRATDEMVKSQFIEMFGNARHVPVGSKFSTTSGGTPSRARSSFFDGGTIPWLTSSEVGQGRIRKTDSFITEEGLKNSSAKWVPKNSVVVAMYGATVGKVGLLDIPCTTNQAVCCILPREDVDPTYLFYAVKSKEEWMVSQAAGAAQPNISQAVIRKMEVPLPSLDEQKLFVSIADQADKSKFDGFKSQFISQFGTLPADNRLSDVAQIYDGVHQTPHYTNTGIRFISVEDISDIYGSNKYISEEDYNKFKHVPEQGDLIMTRIGTIGQCAVVSGTEPLAYYVSVSLIKPDKTKIDSTYLKYYIESGYGQSELRMRSLLEAFPMKINLNEIGKIFLKVPSMEDQKGFVEVVEQADKSKYLN